PCPQARSAAAYLQQLNSSALPSPPPDRPRPRPRRACQRRHDPLPPRPPAPLLSARRRACLRRAARPRHACPRRDDPPAPRRLARSISSPSWLPTAREERVPDLTPDQLSAVT